MKWFLAMLVLFGIGCTACPSPGTSERYATFVGDSLTHQQGEYPEFFRGYAELPGRITNRAWGGTTPCDSFWRANLASVIAERPTDTLVMEYAGHEFDPALDAADWQACMLDLVDTAFESLDRVYVVIPPVSAAFECQWEHPETAEMRANAEWVRDTLPGLRPRVRLVDWRSVFGADMQYRNPSDCIHFTDEGAQLAARTTISVLEEDW